MKLLMLSWHIFLIQACSHYTKPSSDELQIAIDTIKIGKNIIYFNKPLYSRKSIMQYEEGVFITYTLPDSSYLLIQAGAMVNSPISTFKKSELLDHKINNGIETYKGIRNNKICFREDIYYKKIHFIYDGVKPKNRMIFDEIIDNVSIK